MTRTKMSVKRRQERRRLQRETEKAQSRHHDLEDVDHEDLADEPENGQRTGALQAESGATQDRGEGQEGRQENYDDDHDEHEGDNDEEDLLLTEYEKQRQNRIKQNAAKLAALNLHHLASSFLPSHSSQSRVRRKLDNRESNDDEDYMPSSGSDDDEIGEDTTKPNKQDGKIVDEEDQSLQQALAMSLEETMDKSNSGPRKGVSQSRKGKRPVSERKESTTKRRKSQQIKFSSDDIAMIFSVFDEQGRGKFSVTDLKRVACSHDVSWSEQEISDMIGIFDTDKDGQLDLSEFQCIFGRLKGC